MDKVVRIIALACRPTGQHVREVLALIQIERVVIRPIMACGAVVPGLRLIVSA